MFLTCLESEDIEDIWWNLNRNRLWSLLVQWVKIIMPPNHQPQNLSPKLFNHQPSQGSKNSYFSSRQWNLSSSITSTLKYEPSNIVLLANPRRVKVLSADLCLNESQPKNRIFENHSTSHSFSNHAWIWKLLHSKSLRIINFLATQYYLWGNRKLDPKFSVWNPWNFCVSKFTIKIVRIGRIHIFQLEH